MRPIDKFKKSNKPLQRSKLSELDEDILELLRDEFKPKQIHEYITSHRKISVDLSHLYKYIKKLQARDNPIVIDKSKATAATAPAKVTTSSTAKTTKPAVVNSLNTEEQKQPKNRPSLGTRKMSEEDCENALKPAKESNVKYYDPKDFEIKNFGEVITK